MKIVSVYEDKYKQIINVQLLINKNRITSPCGMLVQAISVELYITVLQNSVYYHIFVSIFCYKPILRNCIKKLDNSAGCTYSNNLFN